MRTVIPILACVGVSVSACSRRSTSPVESPRAASAVQADAGSVSTSSAAVRPGATADGGAPATADGGAPATLRQGNAPADELLVAACLGGSGGKGTAVLVATGADGGWRPIRASDPSLLQRAGAREWFRAGVATFLHFDHPKKVEASEEVEQESAQSVSHPRITLGSCEAPSGEVEVLATRPLAPAVWEAPTTRQVEIPEEARPDDGPEPQTLPYRRPSADQPTAPEMELSVRRLAGAGVYELRGTEPAYCWSLETSAVADPTCTPKEPTEDRQSVDSREEGWARVSDAGTWLGARHVYVSGPEGQQEKLEVLEVRADGGIRSAEVVLSTSTD